jgi:Flp pilus assembly protein protease CpaA
MLLKFAIITALCGGALALPALCQERSRLNERISIQASLPFVKYTTAAGVPQNATVNGGLSVAIASSSADTESSLVRLLQKLQ